MFSNKFHVGDIVSPRKDYIPGLFSAAGDLTESVWIILKVIAEKPSKYKESGTPEIYYSLATNIEIECGQSIISRIFRDQFEVETFFDFNQD